MVACTTALTPRAANCPHQRSSPPGPTCTRGAKPGNAGSSPRDEVRTAGPFRTWGDRIVVGQTPRGQLTLARGQGNLSQRPTGSPGRYVSYCDEGVRADGTAAARVRRR